MKQLKVYSLQYLNCDHGMLPLPLTRHTTIGSQITKVNYLFNWFMNRMKENYFSVYLFFPI